jgi:HNH endonuclease
VHSNGQFPAQPGSEDTHNIPQRDQDHCWFSFNGRTYCWATATWRVDRLDGSERSTYLCHAHKRVWQRGTYQHATVGLFERQEIDEHDRMPLAQIPDEIDEHERFIPLAYPTVTIELPPVHVTIPQGTPPPPPPATPAPPPTRADIWDSTSGKCWYCGVQTNPWRDFTIDHVVPQSRGGSDHVSNLVPSCRTCNLRKKTKNLEEFRVYLQSKDIPDFTRAQLSYLRDIGMPLPDERPPMPTHRFWFETQGLTLDTPAAPPGATDHGPAP